MEISLSARTRGECPRREAVRVWIIVRRLQGEQRRSQEFSRAVLSLVVPH